MKSGVRRQILIAFIGAVLLYGVTFWWIENLRNRKGGWQVLFRSDAEGKPWVQVSQPALQITNVQFWFPETRIARTNLQEPVLFNRPITNVPFGKVIFIDTTFLPGTVTFELFGSEVQLLPRVLSVNKREIPWQSGMSIAPGEIAEPLRTEKKKHKNRAFPGEKP